MERDATIAAILADWSERNEQGEGVDPESIIREHPDLESELRAQFAALQILDFAVLEKLETEADVRAGDTLVGAQIGPYRIIRLVGRGGMGRVYLAEQTEPIRRTVAVKLLDARVDDPKTRARFEVEREALALMGHPGIAQVYDAGVTDEGMPYVVMAYVEGEPITEYCDRHGLRVRERLVLFGKVCEAIQHAHQKGVIHRDIKPTNVLVTEFQGEPVPKVIDFGLAKAHGATLGLDAALTMGGQILGTPVYMSPEQARGSPDVDARSDVYALGVLLYELLTHDVPWGRSTLSNVHVAVLMKRILEENPPRPSTRLSTEYGVGAADGMASGIRDRDLRGDLDWIVMRALDKDPDRRYASAQDLADDVGRHLAFEPVTAGPPSTAYRVRKFLRRHRVAAAGVAAVAASLVVGLVVSVVLYRDAEGARRDAVASARTEADARLAAEAAERAATRSLEAKDQEARKASAIRDLLLELLVSARPGYHGANARLVDVLDAAERRLAANESDHPETVAALRHALGTTRLRLGQPEIATMHLTQAVAARTQLLGAKHADTNASRTLLAEALLDSGRLDEARIELESLGSTIEGQSQTPLLTLDARLSEAEGRLETAEALYAALLARPDVKGGPPERRISAQLAHARVLRKLDRAEEASALISGSHKEALETLLPDDPTFNAAQLAWASQLLEQGDATTAVVIAASVAKSVEAMAGPRHPDAIAALELQAQAFALAGRTERLDYILAQVSERRKGVQEDTQESDEDAQFGPLADFPDLVHALHVIDGLRAYGESERAWALLVQGQRRLEAALAGDQDGSARLALGVWLGAWMADRATTKPAERACLELAIQHLDVLLESRPDDVEVIRRRHSYRWNRLTIDWLAGDRIPAFASMQTEVQSLRDVIAACGETPLLNMALSAHLADLAEFAQTHLQRHGEAPVPATTALAWIDEAIAILDRMEPDPSTGVARALNVPYAHMTRAGILMALGRLPDAATELERAIELATSRLEGRMLRGAIFESALSEQIALRVLVESSNSLAHQQYRDFGDLAGAETRYREVVAYLEKIGPTIRDRELWFRNLWRARWGLSDVLLLRGRWAESRRQRDALAVSARRRHERRPTTQTAWELVQIDANRVADRVQRGEADEARAINAALLPLVKELLRASGSHVHRAHLAYTYFNQGECDRIDEEYAAALDGYDRAIAEYDSSIEARAGDGSLHSPNGQLAMQGLGATHSHGGICLRKLGRHEEALEAFRRQLEIHAKLVDLRPGAVGPRQNLAVAHHYLATTLERLGRIDEVAVHHARSAELEYALMEAGFESGRADHLNGLGAWIRTLLDTDDLVALEPVWKRTFDRLAAAPVAAKQDPKARRSYGRAVKFLADMARRIGRMEAVGTALAASRLALAETLEAPESLSEPDEYEETLAEIEARLDWVQAADGRKAPETADEHLARAYALRWAGDDSGAVPHFVHALEGEEIRHDIQQAHRYRAARTAARAAAKAEGDESVQFIAHAIAWLRSDLEYRRTNPDDIEADFKSDEERDLARAAYVRHRDAARAHSDFERLRDDPTFQALFTESDGQ